VTKILVLGGGRQGSAIAADLARSFDVTVADARRVRVPRARSLVVDVAGPGLDRLITRFGLVVGALPSRFGYRAAEAALRARRPVVDISFFAEDAFRLDRAARRAGVFLVPDAGLSPGISNLIVGHLAGARPRRVEIRVGGVAARREQDYVVTWSVDDLIEEYTRPARIRRGGRLVRMPALSGVEPVRVPGVGDLEAFFSDGLRTLLRTIPAPDMSEKTLRWPGHTARMQTLADLGFFRRPDLTAPVLRDAWTRPVAHDLVVLDVVVDGRRATLVQRRHGGLTGMTRTTAMTCAAVAELAARGGIRGVGVLPLETLGAEPATYAALRAGLARRGVRWRIRVSRRH
jgi:saccharopine dehydrogenase-like NADP-dependent oxidoreductase